MNDQATLECYPAANEANARVLIADDQAHVRDALRLLLKSYGYRTRAVSDPADVVEALDSEQFDVVLLDMNYERDTTAGGEGLELVSEIRKRDKNLPMIVMTAWGSVDLAVEAMQRGASEFVQKPWDNRQLLGKLRLQIDRARALRVQERRHEEELREAREIQNRLLPKELPNVADYEIAAMTRPAHCVGGDYYDVVRVSERETVLAIADVAGKGMPAALLMSNLQAALKPLLRQKLAPRELCCRLNRTLCDITPLGKFVSFFCGVLDSQENRLVYCNAGHNPPIVVRGPGAAVELNAAGAVLGQFPDWVYEQSEIRLQSGDALLLFTDGLIDAWNEKEESFGERSLIRIAQQRLGVPAVELMESLLEAASQHCGGHFQDDASIVIVKAI
ncbi:MAG TPA: SpoIIE family protein phosphatase [Terriglobales bacterium]|nr:SpoIIE family protein phosphatase [Terriglobales bacterium]